MIFYDFETHLKEKILHESFLKDYNQKLYYHLIEHFNTNKCATCLFLGTEYSQGGKDWQTGKIWSNSLSDSMKFDEAVERNKIEKKLKPFPPKKNIKKMEN